MREIKFRAWNKDIKEMIYLENSGLQYFDFEGSYSLSFTVDGYSEFWAHEQYSEPTKKAKEFPVMQYTGLKDKNGKEIYEGDIIKSNLGDMCRSGEIKFECGSFIIDDKVEGKYHIYPWNEDTEIVGNVFENPELL